jgi:hypothetical protein
MSETHIIAKAQCPQGRLVEKHFLLSQIDHAGAALQRPGTDAHPISSEGIKRINRK